MVKIDYCCDFCGKPVTMIQYRDQMIYGKCPLKEWTIKNYVICDNCAVKIDYSLLKFKHETVSQDPDA